MNKQLITKWAFALKSIFLITLIAKGQSPTIQDALNKYEFFEGRIIEGEDTVVYYLKKYDASPKNLVVYIQGTDAHPLFSYSKGINETKFFRWFSDDYKHLDSTYTYAIVPKPGMEGLYKEGEINIPQEYYEKNHLEYRIKQVDLTINDIIERHLVNPEKIIVYGHSEGATIGAPLALKNKGITHLGFWSGNVLNNFYEFSLFNRIESLKGNISDSVANENISGILSWYQSVIENPKSTKLDHFGFTNKRWSSYEVPPIDHLLQLEIPIYAYFATEDESTPIETAYLLPIQFMQKRKENLTFEVCMNCDHSYTRNVDGTTEKLWTKSFLKFMDWTKKEY